MAQALPITQAPPMAQAPCIAQTTNTNVLVGITKEPKFIMPEKFDGTRSKFWGFVQHVNLFLQLHPSCYPYDYIQVAFIGSLLLGNVFSWLPPIMEKQLLILQNMAQFEVLLTIAFDDSDRKRATKTKMQSLCQWTRFAAIYAAKFL